jgi:hypothetical protein
MASVVIRSIFLVIGFLYMCFDNSLLIEISKFRYDICLLSSSVIANGKDLCCLLEVSIIHSGMILLDENDDYLRPKHVRHKGSGPWLGGHGQSSTLSESVSLRNEVLGPGE